MKWFAFLMGPVTTTVGAVSLAFGANILNGVSPFSEGANSAGAALVYLGAMFVFAGMMFNKSFGE